MSFTKLAVQPPPRDPALAYDRVAPGLYPDEVAVRLDSGHYVAVSAEPRRLENGGGVAFRAWARWIKGDGETRRDGHGREVELALPFTASVLDEDRYGVAALAKDLMLLVLGEPTVLTRSVPDGLATLTRPVIDVSDEVKLNTSIRSAIRAAGSTGPLAIDPGAVLGLP